MKRMHECCGRSGPGSTVIGYTDHGHAIMFWHGYGVVCPCEVTTNGALRTLMWSWARPAALTDAGAAFFVGRAMHAVHAFSSQEYAP